MKIYIKSSETVTAGSLVKVNSLREVLKIAQTHPIVCISACTDANSRDLNERAKATEDLETLIAASYDYITVNGGWVEPLENGGSKETVEESFIVIGPEYGEPTGRLDAFRDYMVELCDKFHQWAILYISWAEDYEVIDELKRQRREDAYRVFSHPDYIDEERAYEIDKDATMDSIKEEAQQLYDELKDRDHLELYELYGEYLDGSGTTVKTFNNVNAGMIGSYFTTTARKAGAAKFTLMAPMQFYSKYTPTSLANKFITMRGDDHSVEQKRKVVMACRSPESRYWNNTKEKYHSYIRMETKWHWGEFKFKHAPWKK